eukprot:comp20794_c0_seq1/m.27335 comp20794_c0_seq1/g.27335  ORF comp20794_c0_seq1/g.27335 comp20794_c0_seq1/m.27335 type:complete len:376 (-) comp20794_c0_seq1:306-1433(-)
MDDRSPLPFLVYGSSIHRGLDHLEDNTAIEDYIKCVLDFIPSGDSTDAQEHQEQHDKHTRSRTCSKSVGDVHIPNVESSDVVAENDLAVGVDQQLNLNENGVADSGGIREKQRRQRSGWAFFGIFDGHGGDTASRYVCNALHDNLLSFLLPYYADPSGPGPQASDFEQCLMAAYAETETQFCSWARMHTNQSGTCALCVLVSDSSLIVANCGDSTGILVNFNTKGGPSWAWLAPCHNSSDQVETERVLEAGGIIDEEGRISRVLRPTRTIGDVRVKTSPSAGALTRTQSGVLSEPEIRHFLLDEMSKWVAVLASDGLWDFVSVEDVLELVKEGMPVGEDGVKPLAERIADCALSAGSTDDVSVIVFGPNTGHRDI